MNTQPRAQWSSYYSYVLVTTGALVGLGNIFHFPFLTIKYGGLFVLFYVLSEIFISIPLLFAELLLGRRGKQNPVGSFSIVAMETNASHYWRLSGWLCFIILFLTLSYYTVAVAFPLGNFLESAGLIVTSSSFKWSVTGEFISLEMCFLLFLFLTMFVVIRGINRGLEGISRLTVPTYFIILVVLSFYMMVNTPFLPALTHLFHVNLDQPVWPVLLAALTFAFFKLNVGMGSMMVYGSYLPYYVPLGQSTAIVLCLDALASLLSYFIIHPLMLAQPLIAVETLSPQTILTVFLNIPHGVLVAVLFFLATVMAAWTATIAMAESATITLIERCQLSRSKATGLITLGTILVGSFIVFSYIYWQEVVLFSRWTMVGFIQNFATDLATPISALLIGIFCGWVVRRAITFNELAFSPTLYGVWRFLLRYLVPISLFLILYAIGFN